MLLRFASGTRGLIDGNRLSDHDADNTRLTMGEMLIEGELGVLTLNGSGVVSFRAHGSQSIEPINFAWQDVDFAGDCVYETQKHILRHIFTNLCADSKNGAEKAQESGYNRSPPQDLSLLENTAKDYLINRVVESCLYESSDRGCWISICEFAGQG